MRLRNSIVLLFAALLPAAAFAQFTGWDAREASRTHDYDLIQQDIYVSFEDSTQTVFGTTISTLQGLPGPKPFREFSFDATDLRVERVWQIDKVKDRDLKFDTSVSGKLFIQFPEVVPVMTPIKIGVKYSAQPKKGLYFRAPDTMYTKRPRQIWTQGEGEDNHHWFPTYDYPNDKLLTETYVTVSADREVLSNGLLKEKKKNKDGTVTWHYAMDKPHAAYLVMLAIGNYKVVTEKWNGVPVEYWVYPGWERDALRIFGDTPDMMEFYSTKTGVPYPWKKYAQVPVADFMYGGMENTSATVMNDYILYDKRAGVDYSAQGLIAHELAHQWFGDLVTCRSWLHMWLNESFATYFEALFTEYRQGKDEFDHEMQDNQQESLDAEFRLGKKPIVAADNYTSNHYARGSTVLNMMRSVLGEEGFWATVKHYLSKHAFGSVVTEDLKIAVEEATGHNLTWFFDEWLYRAGHPIFDVSYTYEAKNKLVRLKVRQTQPTDSLAGYFKMPVTVEMELADGTKKTEIIRVEDSSQTFTINAPNAPRMVIFDKGNAILKELKFEKDSAEWLYQLQHSDLAIHRSQAATALGRIAAMGSKPVIEALRRTALRDHFWGTRVAAYKSLIALTDPAPTIDSNIRNAILRDAKPNVRRAALGMLDKWTDRQAKKDIIGAVLSKDSSAGVTADALALLNAIDSTAAWMFASRLIDVPSSRDRLRTSSLNILGGIKTKTSLVRILKFIGERDINRWTRYAAIDQLPKLVSVDSGRVYRALWALGDNGDITIRGHALNRLADMGDAQVLRQLERQAATRPEMKVTYDAMLERMRKRLGLN